MPKTLKLNDLLESNGIAPADTIIMRHKHKELGELLPWCAFHSHKKFNAYQSCHNFGAQGSLKKACYAASFVTFPDDKNVFVGLYKNCGWKAISKEGFMSKPVLKCLIGKGYKFENWSKERLWFVLRRTEIMENYIQKLTLDWDGVRNYARLAANKNFTVHKLDSLVLIEGRPVRG